MFRLLGTGPRAAARQAGALLLLAGVLALLGISSTPAAATRLLVVAACDFALGLIATLVPWGRLGRHSAAALGVPAFAVLGLSTWSFGGVATGTGPFLVLLYAWAGLHFPRWILLAFTAPATAAYLLPLIVAGQPPEVLSSAFVLLPIALAVALLIEAQGRYLRDDRERLARIEHWRSAMMSTLAHDVRTPLSTVQLALDELRNHVTGRTQAMVDTALRQTTRIARLAEELLDVRRIDSTGQLTLACREAPALDLVRDALTHLRSADVTVEVDEDLTLWVDPQRFEQIVVNLVGNAQRYGGPPVIVRITGDGAEHRLEVRDHGPGIPAGLRSSLFSQFAVGGPDGVGLGLWIVRQLAEAHGGRAVAEDRSPGVAMVVTVPAMATRPTGESAR